MVIGVEQTREESGQDTEVEAGSHVSQAEQSPLPVPPMRHVVHEEIGLELTLGLEPPAVTRLAMSPLARFDVSGLSAESSHIGLGLGLPA